MQGSALSRPSGRNKAKAKEAKERNDKHHMKHLTMALNTFTEEYKQRNRAKSNHSKKKDAQFLMELSDRYRLLGDNDKAMQFLEQSHNAFDMSFANPNPTEMEEAEEHIVDQLLKDGNALDGEGASDENSSDDTYNNKKMAAV